MSSQQFVIGVRNLDKCLPDWYYVCGSVAPVTSLSAAIDSKEVLLDENIDTAIIFRGQESAAYNYGLLQLLGFAELQILEREVRWLPVDTEKFEKIVTQTRIETIMAGMDKEDIEYLKTIGVLDLTIVT